ncbi:MAG: hypothetical protein E6J84_10080, partial [Deltaproteobacteria bacterium]
LRSGRGRRHRRPALDHRHAQPRHPLRRAGHELVRRAHLPAVQGERHVAARAVHHHGRGPGVRRREGRRASVSGVGRPRSDQGARYRLRGRRHLRARQPARLHPQQLHRRREPDHLPDRVRRDVGVDDRPVEVHRRR